MTQSARAALRELGFTELEASIYTFVVTEHPVSAYRIAKGVGKAAANVYQAMEGLVAKGAVRVEIGKPRRFRPVPVGELVAHMQTRYTDACVRATTALTALEVPADGEGIFEIDSADLVYEHARMLLRGCVDVVLVDAFPRPLARLLPLIESTIARGCTVALNVYEPVDIPGAALITRPERASEQLERWQGHWLNLSVDGNRHMQALLTEDGEGVVRALWSDSVYLSLLHYSGMVSEILLSVVESCLADGATAQQVADTLKRHREVLVLRTPPGVVKLRSQMGGDGGA